MRLVFFLLFFVLFYCAPPSRSSILLLIHPPTHPVCSPSHAQQPEEEEDGHEEEEGVLPVVIAVVEVAIALVITCILVCSVKRIVGVEDCGEKAEGESTDAERHVKASVPEALKHPASTLWLCSLSLRPRWSFQPGVFLAGASSAVQRDDFLPADACFTNRTLLPAGLCLQPLMETGPAEQVSAHTDDSVSGSVQTNVALEGGPVPLPFALPAAAAAAAAALPVAVAAALSGRVSSSAGRPAVTRGPGIRSRHSVYWASEGSNVLTRPSPNLPSPTRANVSRE